MTGIYRFDVRKKETNLPTTPLISIAGEFDDHQLQNIKIFSFAFL